MNTKEFRAALAIAALVWNFIRTANAEDYIHAAVITAVFLIVMAVIYWYNNSFTEKAKLGDYIKDTVETALEEGDLTKIDKIYEILEEGEDDDN